MKLPTPITVGTRVRITNRRSTLHDQTGVVVGEAAPLQWPVKIDGPRRPDRQVFYFASKDLEVLG